MKKILTTLGVLLCVVLILSVPTKILVSQSQFDISRAVWKVLTEGILLPDLETSAVYYNDFFELPDTTSGYDWDTFTGTSEDGVGVIALSTNGKTAYQFRNAIRGGGGVLLIYATGIHEDSAIYNIQQKYPVVMISPSDTARDDYSPENAEFEARFILNDSTDVGAYIGLQYPDSDSIRGNSGVAGIGFEKPVGVNTWYFRTDNVTGTQSKAMASFTSNSDTGWNTLKFVSYDTNKVTAFFNGVADSTLTTYIPFDSALGVTIEVIAGSLCVDYVKAKQIDRIDERINR